MDSKTFHLKVIKKLAGKFREEDHPRADDGKFGSGGGSAKPKATPKKDKNINDSLDALEVKVKSIKKPKKKVDQDTKSLPMHSDFGPGQATPEESKSLKEYGVTAYLNINNYLRGEGSMGSGAVKKAQAHIEQIDSAMKKSKLTADTKVYRGMTDVAGLAALKDKAVGTTIDVPNYWSTSQDAKVADSFSTDDNSVVFEITLKKGQNAIDMEHFKGTRPGKWSEQELLLPRGSKYKITGHKVVGKTTVYMAEVENAE